MNPALPRVILLATRNAGKLRELRPILADAGLEGMLLTEAGIPESPEEDDLECHETLEENALAKARWFHSLSGMPAMADDSGLFVAALGGAPGVWSKRYSGRADLSGHDLDDANNAKLQRELLSHSNRSAHFSCAAAYVDERMSVVSMGETSGVIVAEARGSHGFGYDAYFLSAELGRTFGEASVAEKQPVSHRGRAFRALVAALRERGGAL